MSYRFDVAKASGAVEDVGADEMRVGNSGTLEFYTDGKLTIVYAPNTYVGAELASKEG